MSRHPRQRADQAGDLKIARRQLSGDVANVAGLRKHNLRRETLVRISTRGGFKGAGIAVVSVLLKPVSFKGCRGGGIARH